MDNKPDTISISASHKEEIQAEHAELFVTVKGTSLVSGDAALQKAREVNQLVEELGQAGLPAEAIQLVSIHAETGSGALLKSSNATYELRLHCEKLEQFPELVSVITNQKNASLGHIEWSYPDNEAQLEILGKAIQKAQTKAHKTAAALGIKLLGVHSFEEKVTDYEPGQTFSLGQQNKGRAMGVVAPQADLTIDIHHSKYLEVRVEIEYLFSGIDPAETQDTPL